MLQELSQGGVSNVTEQTPPSKVVLLMAPRIQIDESTGMLDPVTLVSLKLNIDEKYPII